LDALALADPRLHRRTLDVVTTEERLMANLFVNLAVPGGDGVGAGASVALLGRDKTITVQGTFSGIIHVEMSNDGGATWMSLASFYSTGGKQVIAVAAQQMRVRRAAVAPEAPGSPNVDVASDDAGQQFVTLTPPAGEGIGPTASVAGFGLFKTVVVQGVWNGIVFVEVSEDGVGWATCMTFMGPGIESREFTASLVRLRRAGIGDGAAGTPIVALGAVNDAAVSIASSGGMQLDLGMPQVIPSGGGGARVAFNINLWAVGGMVVDTVGNRFVVPAAGKYLVTANLQWASIAGAGNSFVVESRVARNGSTTGISTARATVDAVQASARGTTTNMSTIVDLVAGDAITLIAFQDTGSDRNLTTGEMGIARVA
jgi:hypothetical protein